MRSTLTRLLALALLFLGAGYALAQVTGAIYLFTLVGSEKVRIEPVNGAYAVYTSTSRLMNGTTYTYNVPLTGFSLAPAATIGTLTLNPAGTLATGTVTMPPTGDDGKTFTLFSTATVTALTLNTSNSATFTPSAPTTIAANATLKFVYNLAGNTWYRIQ